MTRTHNLNAVRDARVLTATSVSSQDEASKDVKAMVQDIVKSSLTQLGVIPQDTPTQSQSQSSTEVSEPPQMEDISSEGEICDSDQEDTHSETPVLKQLVMAWQQKSRQTMTLSPCLW